MIPSDIPCEVLIKGAPCGAPSAHLVVGDDDGTPWSMCQFHATRPASAWEIIPWDEAIATEVLARQVMES